MTDKQPEKQYLFDNPRNVTWLMRIFYAICVLLLVLDFVLYRKVYMSWEKLPLFYALYGFVACVVLVVIAKQMRVLLMRKEDYYDKQQEEGGEQHVDR